MNSNEAKQQVETTFTQPFNESVFKTFSKNLLKDLDESKEQTFAGAYIKDAFKPHITSYKRLGSYIDENDGTLDVLTVKLTDFKKLDRARTMQRNFVSDYLRTRGEKDSAIVAFYNEDYSDWRFSYVRMEYKVEMSDKGQIKVKEELTPARRYSFLVGENEPNHTAQQQIAPLFGDSKLSLSEIEDAFRIESVTKEFFNKYKDLFIKLKEEIDDILTKDADISKDFEEHEISTANFAKKLMGQIVFLYFVQKKGWMGVAKDANWGDGKRGFLSDLFKECKKEGKNYFNDYLEYLFYDALNNENRGTADPSYHPRFKCKIPFLNGGLFEPMNGYDWESGELKIENDIFAEILKTFDLYNFTVREDEPLEKEVAVDPEMLGKVFENLLEVTDRKSKAAFYTPREIVHYMCQESLINYLDTKLNSESEKASKEDIEEFILNGERYYEYAVAIKELGTKSYQKDEFQLPESIRNNVETIDQLLNDIKVCDLAIGSGAFPVAIMNEIVRARMTLTTCANSADTDRTRYNFKRLCILESIYGVDIDAGAIDIAKLRLWLSLVVDEEDFGTIQPLPNLDYKIMCGNSLLGVDLEDMFLMARLPEIETLKQEFFDETNHSKKQELHSKIDDILFEITGQRNCFDFKIHFSEVFNKNKGFDVVIGNPPYGLINKRQNKGKSIVLSEEELKYIKKSPVFEFALGGMINIFRLFIAKSIDVLHDKGAFSEIFPLAFIGDASIGKLRKHILQQHNLLSLEAFPERDNPNTRVFAHAKMSVCIMNMLKGEAKNPRFFIRTHYDKFVDTTNPTTFLSPNQINAFDCNKFTIPIVIQEDAELLTKIYSSSIRMNDVSHCYTGEVDLSLGKEFISDNPSNPSLLRGAGIDRYEIKKKMSQGEFLYLYEKQFLANASSKRINHFTEPRIVLQGITGVNEKFRLKMTIIPQGVYCANSVNYINFSKEIDIHLALGILNSSLLNYVFSRFSTNSNVNGYEVDNLPFPKNILQDIKNNIIKKTKKVLSIMENKDKAESEELLRELDKMVCELYGLTKEEIAIVEGQS